MNQTHFADLPDWVFSVEERSAGVYVVRAVDLSGRAVERTGTDPDELLRRCRADVIAML